MALTLPLLRSFSAYTLMLAACCAAFAQAVPGVSRNSVTIGQSTALTGPSAALALAYHQGAKLYFERINAAGGIQGRSVNLAVLDDAGDANNTKSNARKLAQSGMFVMFGTYGSPQTSAAYEILKETDGVLFAPMAAADELQGANFPGIYSIRPGYSEEALAIVRHSETLGTRKLGIAHGKDAESLSALDAAERTMHGLGTHLVGKSSFDVMDRLLSARPEALLVIGTPQEAAPAIRQARSKGFRGPIYGFSNTGESLLAEQLGPAGAGVVLARVTPRSDNAKSIVVRDLIQDAAAAKLGKPNVYMLEGYIAAKALAEGLRRAGKDLTVAKFRKAMETMSEWDAGGFRLSFDGSRTGSRLVELSLIDSVGKVRE